MSLKDLISRYITPDRVTDFDRIVSATQLSYAVRKMREDAGFTQEMLATKMGTTKSAISRLESDEYYGHSVEMLRRLADACDKRVIITFEERLR